MNYCGNTCRKTLKRRPDYLDVLCRRDYVEREVARFAQQIQPEHYGGNILVPSIGTNILPP